MKFRTSVQMSALFPLVLAIILAIGFGVRSSRIKRSATGGLVAEQLIQAVSALHTSTYRYFHMQNPQTIASLNLNQEWVEKMTLPNKVLPANIRVFQERMAFHLKILEDSLNHLAVTDPVTARSAWDSLRVKIENTLQIMMMTAFNMGRESGAPSFFVGKIADRFFIVLMGVAALAMAATTIGVGKSISAKLISLRNIANEIAKGNFRGRLEFQPGDDLA